MDTAIFLSVLLLVGLTWLLYKLAVMLEARSDKSTSARHDVDATASLGRNVTSRRQRPIHQRLRK